MALALRRHTRCRRFIPLTLDLDDLRLQLGQSLDLPCDLAAETAALKELDFPGKASMYC